MRLLPARFTFGLVLCRWWAELVSFKHDAWNWGSSDQRILFLTVWGSFRCFFANSKCVFMCLHWGEDESGHTAIKPRLMERCSDVCPSVGFSYLHIWSWSSTRVTIRFLVHHSNQSPSPSIAQFGQEASSRKNPGCFKLFPLRVQRLHASVNLQWSRFFSELFPRCVAWRNPVSELYRQFFFYLRAWFLLWYALSAVRPFIKTYAFPNHTHSIEFATG